ncbi:MAG: hypothetical protein AB7J13_16235, partial [Pyrinomonadaceae bacterium]
MRTDPADNRDIVAVFNRAKYVRIGNRRNDHGLRTLSLDVFGNKSVAANNEIGPLDQLVRLAESLEKTTELTETWADISDVCSIVQIKDKPPKPNAT